MRRFGVLWTIGKITFGCKIVEKQYFSESVENVQLKMVKPTEMHSVNLLQFYSFSE